MARPRCLVEDGPEAQLVEQGADDEDRPPVRGIAELGILGIESSLAGEEPPELGEDLEEEVLASEIGDDALLDLAAFAVGFDDADVFVDGAAGGADFDGSRVHENHYHDESRRNQGIFCDNSWRILTQIVTTLFGPARGLPCARDLENKAFSRAAAAGLGGFTPNMG